MDDYTNTEDFEDVMSVEDKDELRTINEINNTFNE